MPVLARTLEEAGLATVMVTPMPYWAERIGVPRTLAVEFPFVQTLGMPHRADQQMQVICQALTVLENAQGPGEIVHSPEVWPEPLEQAREAWHPAEPPPLMKVLVPRAREMLKRWREQEAKEKA